MIAGIDFGSKKAGTTAICKGDKAGNIYEISQSKKEKDADQFLIDFIGRNKIKSVFIDAPLSLPGVYTGMEGFDDYFYRNCDREIGAMSPMFLGGLTARAIKLKQGWIENGIEVIEVWPTKIAEITGIEKNIYKSGVENLGKALSIVYSEYSLEAKEEPVNWHQFDALLAYIAGLRYINRKTTSYGNPDEGLIYV